MLTRCQVAATGAVVALFLTPSSQSQDLAEVAHKYLQRHGVPCLAVTHVDRTRNDMDIIATCHDGREWAPLMVEGEVAFVHPRTRDLYRWQHEVYREYPDIYTAKPAAQDDPLADD